MLCGTCLQAFHSQGPIPWTAPKDALEQDIYTDTQWVPHHPSFQNLKASVDLKCSVCTEFWNRQSPSVIRWLESEISSSGGDAHRQTNITPAIKISQPGTRLGIYTSVLPTSAPADRVTGSRVGQIIMVNGYQMEENTRNYQKSFEKNTDITLQPEGMGHFRYRKYSFTSQDDRLMK